MFHHSIRTYLSARLVAARLTLVGGRDHTDDLLFAACAMHDLGVASDSPHRQRFEVEGANWATELLIERGVPAADADQVWQAIALHTSPGIAEHRGMLCVLVRDGVALDFGGPAGSRPRRLSTAGHGRLPHRRDRRERREMFRSLRGFT